MHKERVSSREGVSEARRIALDLTDEDRELSAVHCLAEGARMAGDLDEARAHYAERLERNRARGAQLLVAVELSNLGYVEKASGRLEAAEANVREAIPISIALGNSYSVAHNLVALAAVVAAAGRAEEVAGLLGKADAIFAETGLVLDPADKPEYDGAVAAARAALGDDAYDAAYASGVNLDPPRSNRSAQPENRASIDSEGGGRDEDLVCAPPSSAHLTPRRQAGYRMVPRVRCAGMPLERVRCRPRWNSSGALSMAIGLQLPLSPSKTD